MKNIAVSNENWRKLRKKRIELGLKHNNELISYFFDKLFPEETTSENNDNIKKQKKEQKRELLLQETTNENGDTFDI